MFVPSVSWSDESQVAFANPASDRDSVSLAEPTEAVDDFFASIEAPLPELCEE